MVAYSCAAWARWWPSIHQGYAAFCQSAIHNIRSYLIAAQQCFKLLALLPGWRLLSPFEELTQGWHAWDAGQYILPFSLALRDLLRGESRLARVSAKTLLAPHDGLELLQRKA